MHTPESWLQTLSVVTKKPRSSSSTYFRPRLILHRLLPYALVNMRTIAARRSEFFWARQVVKKWLNIKSSGDEFNADAHEDEGDSSDPEDQDGDDLESPQADEASPTANRHSTSREESPQSRLSLSQDKLKHRPTTLLRWQSEPLDFTSDMASKKQDYRISVGTWNVAGRLPPDQLDVDEWLDTSEPADIYVLGFQEVVPLNAGNVLGAEDDGPAAKWDSLIRHTLNKMVVDNQGKSPVENEGRRLDSISEGTVVREKLAASLQSEGSNTQDQSKLPAREECIPTRRKIREYPSIKKSTYENCDEYAGKGVKLTFSSEDENVYVREETVVSPLSSPLDPRSSEEKSGYKRPGYFRVASKQMVGIFVTIWVRTSLRRYVHNIKVSSVGLGLMGYLGNKGSVSISMSLFQTSFCFVCTHLTSGNKEGDELKRNSDVSEILKRTHFPRTSKFSDLPETILGHDRIVWLGDLNYRLTSSANETRQLVARQQWDTLLSKDQLKREQDAGRIFGGWHEGAIYFAPTYKYIFDSDQYFGQVQKPGEKQRAPAWCDRILWYGKGLTLLSYVRSESKLSDHRPVTSVFLAEVEVGSRKIKKTWPNPETDRVLKRGRVLRRSLS